ncbi:MAG: glycine cleavage system aminomethyltransferase GcvT [Sphaerochaetaceae bacterium]
MKRTPIYAVYGKDPGAKLIDFGGWELPVNFGNGIIFEHTLVRTKAGLFDVSHMGECLVKGKESTKFLSWICTNHIANMKDTTVMYTLMCYENGTVVDDLLVYKRNEEEYLVVLNAANTDKDIAWMQAHEGKYDCKVTDCSKEYVQLALQGPLSVRILSTLVPSCSGIASFTFRENVSVGGVGCLVSRTGYTGEDGFELYCPSDCGVRLWNILIKAGEPFGLAPCGLGARDTLRLEAKLPLYGHEISDSITPLEANLGVFVDLTKDDFCGKAALSEQKEKGVPRSLRGVEMVEGGVPRSGYKVFLADEEIGFVTSGTKSPTLDKFIGYVMIKRETNLKFGDKVFIEIHNKRKEAVLVRTPFYRGLSR